MRSALIAVQMNPNMEEIMSVMQKAEALLGRMLKIVPSSNEKLASNKADAAATITVSSPAFKNGMPIPRQYAQDGVNISPPLQWSGVPSASRELVLVVEDPDAPMPNPIVHWVVFGIAPTTSSLPENLPQGPRLTTPVIARQGSNYNKEHRYTGPKPPVGHGVHHYHFQLFALDKNLSVGDAPEKNDLLKTMQGHVLAQGELIGTYERVAPE
jgi:hypothetical protein